MKDADGEPLDEGGVHLRTKRNEQTTWGRYLVLDDEGRAQLYDWVEEPINIRVSQVDLTGLPLAEVRGVLAQQGLFEIKIPPVQLVELRGTIVDSHGAPVPESFLVLLDNEESIEAMLRVYPSDGVFKGELLPATYRPRVEIPHTGCFAFDPIELHAGEPQEVSYSLPNLVQLKPMLSSQSPPSSGEYRIQGHCDVGRHRDAVFTIATGKGAPRDPLEVIPGTYSIQFQGDDQSTWAALVHIEPGSHGQFAVEKGAPPFVTIRFGDGSVPLPPSATMRITPLAQEGAEPYAQGTPADLAPCGRWILQLPPDRYLIEVLRDGETMFSGTCEVHPYGTDSVVVVPAK